MTNHETAAVDRIPIAHSVRYAARGLPEVPNQYGDGVLAPSEITLTYRAAPDSQLGRVHAYVAGRIWVDGAQIPLLPGGLYGQHYDDGLDGWPEWLAEEARLHDPEAAVSVPPPATRADDRAALRDRAAEAIRAGACPGSDCRLSEAECSEQRIQPAAWERGVLSEVYGRPEWFADAVLAVLPEPADRAAFVAEAEAKLTAGCPDHGPNGGWLMTCQCEAIGVLQDLAAEAAVSGPCVAGEQQNETPEAEREPDPDCEHCDGSGLDPDAYFVNGNVWTHAPCSECLPEDDEPEPTAERVKHSGPETKFCVLCLSGEHERVAEVPE